MLCLRLRVKRKHEKPNRHEVLTMQTWFRKNSQLIGIVGVLALVAGFPLGKRDLLNGGFLWISCGFRFMLHCA